VGKTDMVRWFKRFLFVLVVGFCLFYLVNQPEGAAAAVRNVIDALGRAISSIFTFFTTLAS
jgi:hypothetical protein